MRPHVRKGSPFASLEGNSTDSEVLSLLEEQENQLQCAALQRLNEVVDQFWHEIADYLNEIETLYEARQTKSL